MNLGGGALIVFFWNARGRGWHNSPPHWLRSLSKVRPVRDPCGPLLVGPWGALCSPKGTQDPGAHPYAAGKEGA